MREIYGFDSYSPKEIAERVQSAGVVKARLPLLQTAMLGMLAGAFIGLGALYYALVVSDASLGFAMSRVLGGVCFSMGLLFVVVAGAELFTGNNLLAMAWAEGTITSSELLRNWVIVCFANFVGALGVALLVFLSGHWQLNDGAIGQTYLKIAAGKAALDPWAAFFRGVLCNLLVCMAVWMAMSGRSVVDRFVAIVLPISGFVAAGFEHSVANMYFFPMALMIKSLDGPMPAGADAITVSAMFSNLGLVIAGNLVGGSVLVALVYWVIYLRGARKETGSD
ncbi:MAG: formate/nitrite transporter family protein [Usitatibacteraceae bacterium]